jgi:transposase
MSYHINLTNREEASLKELIKNTERSKILKRYQCIHFKHQGLSNAQIAELLCVNIDTVTDWIKIFLSKRLNGFGEFEYEGRRVSQLEEHKGSIKKYVDENIVSSIKQLQGYIENTYNLTVEHSWLFRYCKKNSIVLTKRPKAILQK